MNLPYELIEIFFDFMNFEDMITFSKTCNLGQELLQSFNNKYIDSNQSFENVFQYLCSMGNLEMVKSFLADSRLVPSNKIDKGLSKACHYGHLEITKILLSNHRISPQLFPMGAFYEASINGHEEIAKELMKDSRFQPLLEFFNKISNDSQEERILSGCSNGFLVFMKKYLENDLDVCKDSII